MRASVPAQCRHVLPELLPLRPDSVPRALLRLLPASVLLREPPLLLPVSVPRARPVQPPADSVLQAAASR